MQREKILIIDDDDGHKNAIQYLLEKENYAVISANNGKTGLSLLDKHDDIQVLVIDLAMLDLSGVDILKQIKNREKPLRRIVLTGHDEELPHDEAQNLKVYCYLNKPVTKHSLIFTIKSAINDLRLENIREELHLAKQWEDIAILTTDSVHWVGNKIGPIPRRVDNIRNKLEKLHNSRDIDVNTYNNLNIDLDIIRKGADSALSIKSDLIDKSTAREDFDLIKLIQDVIYKFKKEYSTIQINFHKDITTYKFRWDPKAVERIFHYVLKNAIQAIEDKITNLSGQNKEFKGKIKVNVYRDDNCVIIEFQDNGCGILEQDISRIFKPFYTTKGADRGSGVGLFFCKRTMEELGGKIYVKSTEANVGATFCLEFTMKE